MAQCCVPVRSYDGIHSNGYWTNSCKGRVTDIFVDGDGVPTFYCHRHALPMLQAAALPGWVFAIIPANAQNIAVVEYLTKEKLANSLIIYAEIVGSCYYGR